MSEQPEHVDSETSPGDDPAPAEHGDDEARPEQPGDDETDTFPRSYVEKLRKENATYRERAQRADDYAQQLHHARVAATGRLADPSDLEFDESHLDDQAALEAAIDELLHRKPHLAARTVDGDVGQGQTGSQGVDLAGMLRARA